MNVLATVADTSNCCPGCCHIYRILATLAQGVLDTDFRAFIDLLASADNGPNWPECYNAALGWLCMSCSAVHGLVNATHILLRML